MGRDLIPRTGIQIALGKVEGSDGSRGRQSDLGGREEPVFREDYPFVIPVETGERETGKIPPSSLDNWRGRHKINLRRDGRGRILREGERSKESGETRRQTLRVENTEESTGEQAIVRGGTTTLGGPRSELQIENGRWRPTGVRGT